MLARLPTAPKRASGNAVGCDSKIPVGCDSDDSDWFGAVARNLLGKDAGFALHLITGAPEGSCYKYVTTQPATRRQPPAGLLRRILRSDHGAQFLAAVMEGSDAEWWSELQRARRVVDFIHTLD